MANFSSKQAPISASLNPSKNGDFSVDVSDRVHVVATGVEALWKAALAGRFTEHSPCGPIAELVADRPVLLQYSPESKRVQVIFTLDKHLVVPSEQLDQAAFDKSIKSELGADYFVDGDSVYHRHSKKRGDYDRVAKLPAREDDGAPQGGLQAQLTRALKGRFGGGVEILMPGGMGEPEVDQLIRFRPMEQKVETLEDFSKSLQTAAKLFLVYLDAASKVQGRPLPLERMLIEAPNGSEARGPRSPFEMMMGPAMARLGNREGGEPMTMSDLPFLGLKERLKHRGLISTPEQVEFSEIRAQPHAVGTMQDYALQLKLKDEFERRGGFLPRGIMMVGPAGNGKTTLARAVAYKAGVPFILVMPTEVIDGLVGATEKRVQSFFDLAAEEAEKNALKHAILFFDEIDGVAGDSNYGGSFGKSLVGVLNQTMEGFRRMKNVTVMAASNRPLELANATLSRFELVLPIQNPDQAGRADILKSRFEYRERLSNTRLQGEIDYGLAAARTDGFSGRDLDDLANATCTAVAKRTLFESGERDHKKIELISTGDILTTLKTFVKLSEGARRRIGYHPD